MAFKRSEREEQIVQMTFDGQPLQAAEGDNLAAALLVAGVKSFRKTPQGAEPRGPYCMMGVCFECLVEVDSRENQQACMISVRDGMSVRRQKGFREVGK